MGLIELQPKRHISQIGEGVDFNLSDYVTLTPRGQHWVDRAAELAAPGDGSAAGTIA